MIRLVKIDGEGYTPDTFRCNVEIPDDYNYESAKRFYNAFVWGDTNYRGWNGNTDKAREAQRHELRF